MKLNVYKVISDGNRKLCNSFDSISEAEAYIDEAVSYANSANKQMIDEGFPELATHSTEYIIERPELTTSDKLVQLQNRVVMANAVINDMEYGLTKQCFLLLRYMISKIAPEDKPNKIYSISMKEFFKICGIDEKNGGNYVRIAKQFFEIVNTKIKWMEHKGDKYPIQWFSSEDFVIKKNRTIEYRWHKRIVPYIFDLVHYKEGYTGYIFEDIVAMNTKYGVRLYEWIREYKNMGLKYKCISLEELKEMLGGNYKLYNDFNRFILRKAVEDINNTSNINLTYKGLRAKGSKAITSIQFNFGEALSDEEIKQREINKQFALDDALPF